MSEYTKEFLDKLNSVKSKRPRTVIQHILEHGYITTEELKNVYGYNHPPRAIRDVKDLGISIISYRVIGQDGRRIAAYRLEEPNDMKHISSKLAGRNVLSKALKKALIEKYGAKCFIYLEEMDASSLQIDHRIPYEIGGECDEEQIECFMLLSPSANRAKSWTCEHCKNWIKKDKAFCMKCFWAYPEEYEHVAGKYQKVISIMFSGDEVEDYNKLIRLSGEDTAQATIKNILHKYLG